jgi:hypothetical protein
MKKIEHLTPEKKLNLPICEWRFWAFLARMKVGAIAKGAGGISLSL